MQRPEGPEPVHRPHALSAPLRRAFTGWKCAWASDDLRRTSARFQCRVAGKEAGRAPREDTEGTPCRGRAMVSPRRRRRRPASLVKDSPPRARRPQPQRGEGGAPHPRIFPEGVEHYTARATAGRRRPVSPPPARVSPPASQQHSARRRRAPARATPMASPSPRKDYADAVAALEVAFLRRAARSRLPSSTRGRHRLEPDARPHPTAIAISPPRQGGRLAAPPRVHPSATAQRRPTSEQKPADPATPGEAKKPSAPWPEGSPCRAFPAHPAPPSFTSVRCAANLTAEGSRVLARRGDAPSAALFDRE